MVLPLIIGAIGAVTGTVLLAGVISHLVGPVSLLAAVVGAIGSFLYLNRLDVLGVIGDENTVIAAHAAVALVLGLIAYKAFVWAVAAAGILAGLALIVVVLVGGAGLLQVVLLSVINRFID